MASRLQSILLLVIFSITLLPRLYGNVASGTGRIKFDVNNDGISEMELNSDGLAIGQDISASANLYVNGNAIVSDKISVGVSTINSANLYLSGSLSHSVQTASSNVNIEHSVVLGDTSSGNLVLTLPTASSVPGRLIAIKKISTLNNITVSGGGDIDGSSGILLSSGNLGYIKFVSFSGNWFILSIAGNGIYQPTPTASISIQSIFVNDAYSVSGVSSGDNIHVVFSDNTNHPEVSSKNLVDALIDFGGKTLGADYEGYWNLTGNILTISVLDPSGSSIAIGDTLSVLAGGDLKFEDGSGAASTSSGTISGNFGTAYGDPPTGTPTAGALYEWDAGADTAADGVWEDEISDAFDWAFNTTPQSPSSSSDSRFPNISRAYTFPGAKTAATTSFQTTPGTIDGQSVTFEMLLDIDTTDASIFDMGGSTSGTQIDVSGNVLRGTTSVSNTAHRVTYSLTSTDSSRFIHLIYVVDLSSDNLALYIDGDLKDTLAVGGLSDWAGGNDGAVGTSAGTIPSGGETGDFSGDISLFRIYSNKALTSSEVQANYDAIAGSVINIDNTKNYPLISSAYAANVASGNYGLDIGDTVTIVFSGNTNKPNVTNSSNIDLLIDFGGQTLANDYVGAWNSDGNTLTITVSDNTSGNLEIGQTVSILASANLKFSGDLGNASNATATLTGSFGTGWLPSYMTSPIILWYDASDLTTISTDTGANVLADKSGNDYHAVQATGARQPSTGTRTLNGKNVLDFDGTDDGLRTTNVTLPADGDFMIFMVSSNDGVSSSGETMHRGSRTDFSWRLKTEVASGWRSHFIAQNGTDFSGPKISGFYPGPAIYGAIINKSTGNVSILNDGTQSSINNYLGPDFIEQTQDEIILMTNTNPPDANSSIDGLFAEYLIVDGVDEELRQIIEGYLAHKWGLSDNLISGHPYEDERP